MTCTGNLEFGQRDHSRSVECVRAGSALGTSIDFVAGLVALVVSFPPWQTPCFVRRSSFLTKSVGLTHIASNAILASELTPGSYR